jgi:hypothetical protein
MSPHLPLLEAVRAQVTDWLMLGKLIPAGALIDSATPAVVALRAIRDDAGIIVTTLHKGLTDAETERDALRARAEAAEAALATARAEGAAAERAAVVVMLRTDLGSFEVANADADDYVRDLIKDIEDGVHTPPRGGRITAAQEGA